MLVGSCYSCSVAIKCGGGGIVWGMLIPLLCLNQGPIRGVSTLTASFLGINDFIAREHFIIVFLEDYSAARTNVVTTEPWTNGIVLLVWLRLRVRLRICNRTAVKPPIRKDATVLFSSQTPSPPRSGIARPWNWDRIHGERLSKQQRHDNTHFCKQSCCHIANV